MFSVTDDVVSLRKFSLLATGGRFGKVNSVGITFYNRLIDALLLKGIASPFCFSFFLAAFLVS